MKMIVAIIQPEKLEDVRKALIDAEIFRLTISRASGHGKPVDESLYRGQVFKPNLQPKMRIEIALNDHFVEPAIQAILEAARKSDGAIGDGKIFVMPMEDCIRIRTGERGGEAI